MITIYRKDGKITKVEVDQAGRWAILNDYSRLMQRLEKANKYMNNELIPASDKEKQVSLLKSLFAEISSSLNLLKWIGEDWETHKWFE